ncbi:MAG: iron-sulfur cluster repair di-iron protein [Candidatus Eisenbacteria bacterium]|uniref:Iron-sulfur cluster repair di-iron protein n=1 Tax=Eiseniibacteriota bacterium TaxID=2212470 RepID=A0A956M1J2_UNCEI|nr:iron-sulfur cluster repair di-iron protein [Candidatus Eisenbacteria bacterium]
MRPSASPSDTHASLAELATTYPAASRVFQRERLDYCCGGGRAFDEACVERGLDPATLLDEIRESDTGFDRPWTEQPLPELIEYIVEHYHADLREELPLLVELAEKVELRHADKDTCPRGLTAHLRHVHAAVLDHLAKEEQVLFPLILAGMGTRAAAPVHAMEHEHHDHGANLAHIRELAHDLVPPAEACPSWQALYLRLARLESELMEHIHLENNVLFPRALCD